jgi:hypothetical protein
MGKGAKRKKRRKRPKLWRNKAFCHFPPSQIPTGRLNDVFSLSCCCGHQFVSSSSLSSHASSNCNVVQMKYLFKFLPNKSSQTVVRSHHLSKWKGRKILPIVVIVMMLVMHAVAFQKVIVMKILKSVWSDYVQVTSDLPLNANLPPPLMPWELKCLDRLVSLNHKMIIVVVRNLTKWMTITSLSLSHSIQLMSQPKLMFNSRSSCLPMPPPLRPPQRRNTISCIMTYTRSTIMPLAILREGSTS